MAMGSLTTNTLLTYRWHGKDRLGKKQSGEIQAASTVLARAKLRQKGIIVKRIKRKSTLLMRLNKKPIKTNDVSLFTRQLATMLKAGVPVVKAFDIISEGLENNSMDQVVTDIKNEISAGSSLAAALAKHPQQFDNLFCSLVNAGEQSGALDTMLDRIATYKEKTEALKSKVKKALSYPIAVVAVSFVVTGILLIKVVPQFAQTFSSFDAELPAFTRFVMQLSEWAQVNAFFLLIMIVCSILSVKIIITRSKKMAIAKDRLLLRLPIIGNIIKQTIVARFARTLSTTFAAGVSLVESLETVAETAGNQIYHRAIKDIANEVISGQTLHQAISMTDRFPSMLIQMVAIGEESGSLDEMLTKVANNYEQQVDNSVDSLTSLLEPFIMSVLG
jgi:type IV pilus assembly protein PilC